jgi:aspartate aminotransferase
VNTYFHLLNRLSEGGAATKYFGSNITVEVCLDLSLGQIVGDHNLPPLDSDTSSEIDWHCGYPPPRGDPKLIEAYLAYLSRANRPPSEQAEILPSNVLVTQGGKHALWLAFCLLIKPGSRVKLPEPGWMPYRLWAEALGAIVSTYKPNDDGYEEALASASNGYVDVMVVCSPNNPTSHELSPNALGDLISKLDARGVSAIFDDVYHSLSSSGMPISPFALRARSPMLVVDSMSKSLGAAGLRIGFLVGPPSLLSQALQIHAMTLSGVSSVSQAIATRALLTDYDQRLKMTRRSVDARRKFLCAALDRNGIPIHSAGGMYLWLSPSSKVNEDIVDLNSGRLRGAPGALFGAPGFLRLCATSATETALERLC